MRQVDKIELKQRYSKKIRLVSEETELVREYKQSGSGSVVHFNMIVKPNDSNFIVLQYVPSNDADQYIPFIHKGVQRYIENLQSEGISLGGITIEVSDCYVHPVDFRPYKIEFTTLKVLNRLIFQRGLKSMLENTEEVPVAPEKSINEFFSVNSLDLFDFNVFEIHLPNRGNRKMKLSKNHILSKVTDTVKNETVELKVFSNSSDRHDNYIRIYSTYDKNMINTKNSLINGVVMFKNDMYQRGLDLYGCDIVITRSDAMFGSSVLSEFIYWQLITIFSE